MSGKPLTISTTSRAGNNADELEILTQWQLKFLFKDSVVKAFNLQKIIDNAKH